jgi:small-conductance mechanosensitive channel
VTFLGASVLERAGEAVGDYLPRLAGALAVLVIGLLLVRLLARGLRGLLTRLGLDDMADRAGVHDVLARAGLERSLSRVVTAAIRVALTIAVVLAALSLLGLGPLDQAINEAVLFLPNVLAALALVLAGAVLGSLARDWVERTTFHMDLRGPLAPAAQWFVIGVSVILALAQLGISTTILTVLAGIVAGGAVLTVALAFGLGGRELAREMSAGRYVGSAFQVGQEITVRGHRGQIVAIEGASTVLGTDDGTSVRIPNHLFLESDVVVHGRGERSSS